MTLAASKARRPDNHNVKTLSVIVGNTTPAAQQPWGATVYDLTLAEDITLANPAYLTGEFATAGDEITVIFRQDGTGSQLLTLDTLYLPATITLSTTASAVDVVKFVFDGTNWLCVSFSKALAG